ncbi:hypothetical protein H4219_006432, partial [Mycoemilia scoparia]
KSINSQAGYLRAVDWIGFVLHIVPTIVINLMTDTEDKKALMNLVKACSLIQKLEITEEEVSVLENL